MEEDSEIRILGRVGKAMSKNLWNSHKLKKLNTGEMTWTALREFKIFRKQKKRRYCLSSLKIRMLQMPKLKSWRAGKKTVYGFKDPQMVWNNSIVKISEDLQGK